MTNTDPSQTPDDAGSSTAETTPPETVASGKAPKIPPTDPEVLKEILWWDMHYEMYNEDD